MNKLKLNKKKKEDILLFGFWIYLMSDCILFAVLFAVYFVLYNNYVNFLIKNIFNIKYVFIETCFLLFSSIFYAFSMYFIKLNKIINVNLFLFLTFIFGFLFVIMEFYEFFHLINNNYYPSNNALFSIFFTLIGTHCFHIIFGLIWILVMISHLFKKKKINTKNKIGLKCLGLFWHFLDIIWICIYSIIYLIGSF